MWNLWCQLSTHRPKGKASSSNSIEPLFQGEAKDKRFVVVLRFYLTCEKCLRI